jgi:NAD(P)-dependent dehydrogenase (short-subunit alcohol dehydrogenase family)
MTENAAPTFSEIPTPARFSGLTVIVTGAGSGIGRATALRIAREGGRVVASDLSGERLDALVGENPTLDLAPVVGDVTQESDVARIVSAAGDGLYGLVNNAGVMDAFQSIGEVDDATWQRVFSVNVDSVLRMTRAALPAMLAAGRGSVVNVSSEAGLRGSCAGAAYTASKHAVVGITRNSAVMYAKTGVRFNTVAPGPTATNIQAEFASALAAETLVPLMGTNLPRMAQPEELAATIAYLLSPDASNVSGAVVACDSGWSAI